MCQLSNRFFSAIRTLSGNGPIKRRLARAYAENLDLLKDDDIPESIRPRFLTLRQAMHSVKPANRQDSPIVASVRKMSSDEASRHAKTIVAMFSELVRVKSTGERLTAGQRSKAAKRPAKSPSRNATLN